MAQFDNMFNVDLKNSSSQIANIKAVYQGNANANRVGAIVFNGGEPYPLAGTCAGGVSRSDGTFVPLTGVISGNTAYVVLDSRCYELLGSLRITVTVSNGNEETTLISVYGNVMETAEGTIIQPAERLPDYVQLLGEIENMRRATAEAEAVARAAGALAEHGSILHLEVEEDGNLYMYCVPDTPVMFELIDGDLYVYRQ